MADEKDTTGSRGSGGTGGSSGNGGGSANRRRNQNRNRNRNRPAPGREAGAPARGHKAGNANGRGGKGRGTNGSNRSGAKVSGRPRPTDASRGAATRTAPALAPAPPAVPAQSGVGAPQIHPAEVAANRRRSVALCGYTAIVPALVVGVLCWVVVSVVVAVVAFVVCGVAVMIGLWRVAPAVALRRVGAVPMGEDDDPRLSNITEGLCATFGLSMPTLFLVDESVPNACALGRDARRSALVVTRGLLEQLDPIELEGVVAHELAHVKRADNGVSCVGITLATLLGGESMLRRCVGGTREYRADVVGASTVRYPRGLLSASCGR